MTKEVPNIKLNFEPSDDFEEEKGITTPEDCEREVDKLPVPTGYRILILPYTIAKKTKGGIVLAKETVERERLATNVGYVVALGPDAYTDPDKYPCGAWCKKGDWIIFGRYAGARIKIDGGEMRLLNDDEVLAVVNDPENVVHHA
jgi:chaperonin GroES